MAKIYAIANRKGGCGKSTSVVNLGASLAKQGKKVLVLDGDSQHSLTVSLGVKEPDKLQSSLSTLITDIISNKDIKWETSIITHSEGMALLPSNNSLAGIEITLAPLMGRETVMGQLLEVISPHFDVVLIDTPPTLDLLTINALAAAHSVIIPVAPKFLDAKGLELLLKSIAQIRRFINPNLSIAGILLTMVDRRSKFTKEITGMIEEAYGEQIRIFKSQIPYSVRAVESSATGRSIFEYEPNGRVALAYAALALELFADGLGCSSPTKAPVRSPSVSSYCSAARQGVLANA